MASRIEMELRISQKISLGAAERLNKLSYVIAGFHA